MKKSHLTVRLPTDLARALARRARTRGVPKSQVAREAVARYLAPVPPPAGHPTRVTARALALRWTSLARLSPAEGRSFQEDISAGRDALPPVRSPWG